MDRIFSDLPNRDNSDFDSIYMEEWEIEFWQCAGWDYQWHGRRGGDRGGDRMLFRSALRDDDVLAKLWRSYSVLKKERAMTLFYDGLYE